MHLADKLIDFAHAHLHLLANVYNITTNVNLSMGIKNLPSLMSIQFFGMGNTTTQESTLSGWLEAALERMGWTQRKLANMAGTTPTTISELISGKQGLSAAVAEKLASVPELKTSAEELLAMAGVWQASQPSRSRSLANTIFDKLSHVEQDLVIDFMVMLAQRERGRDRD